MGGAVSAGEDNEELVDNLVEADYVKTPSIETALRVVDRGNYYLEGYRDTAYKDLAWKNGNLHLSAPCIYSEVLESLKLSPGQSFLNLGSGTGYLSTVAGLLLGTFGINHGVEQYADVVDYANDRLAEFIRSSSALDLMEFCLPSFVVGNCLQLEPACSVQAYDRVYCGAAVPPEYLPYMRNLVKVGGVAVMPSGDQLLQIHRVKDDVWETKSVLPVSFATLVEPTAEKRGVSIMLPDRVPLKLQDMCRETVRSVLRKNILEENPGLKMRSVLLTRKRRSSGENRRHSGGSSDGDEDTSASRRRRRFIRRILIPVFHAESDDDEPDLPFHEQPPEQSSDGSGNQDTATDTAEETMQQTDGSDGNGILPATGVGPRRRSRRPIIAIGSAGVSLRSGGRLHMEDLRWNRFYVGGNRRRSTSPDEDDGTSEQKQQNDDNTSTVENATTDEDIRDPLDCEQQLLLSGAVDGDGHSTTETDREQEQEQPVDGSNPETKTEGVSETELRGLSGGDLSSDEDENEDLPALDPKISLSTGKSQSTARSVADSVACNAASGGSGESSKRSHSESEVPEAEARRKRAAATAGASSGPRMCQHWRGLASDGESDASDAESDKYREEQRQARHENVAMQKKFSQAMMVKISSLPVPDSVKTYLNYYRNSAMETD